MKRPSEQPGTSAQFDLRHRRLTCLPCQGTHNSGAEAMRSRGPGAASGLASRFAWQAGRRGCAKPARGPEAATQCAVFHGGLS